MIYNMNREQTIDSWDWTRQDNTCHNKRKEIGQLHVDGIEGCWKLYFGL